MLLTSINYFISSRVGYRWAKRNRKRFFKTLVFCLVIMENVFKVFPRKKKKSVDNINLNSLAFGARNVLL